MPDALPLAFEALPFSTISPSSAAASAAAVLPDGTDSAIALMTAASAAALADAGKPVAASSGTVASVEVDASAISEIEVRLVMRSDC